MLNGTMEGLWAVFTLRKAHNPSDRNRSQSPPWSSATCESCATTDLGRPSGVPPISPCDSSVLPNTKQKCPGHRCHLFHKTCLCVEKAYGKYMSAELSFPMFLSLAASTHWSQDPITIALPEWLTSWSILCSIISSNCFVRTTNSDQC
jgi:hypothetical protein